MAEESREMALDEWMARLPSHHRANRELAEIRTRAAGTTIPGMEAKRIWISDSCRELHGDEGAFDTAMKILQREYRAILAARKQSGQDKGIKYHLVLTVETPQ